MATILIIDDSLAQRAAIREVLEASGSFERILEAGNGLEGLKLLLGEEVDAVLCDLEMPGLDGEKLLRAKRCRPQGGDIPFLVLTANRDLDRRARLLREGASDTITKPFHPADLVARLELHLKIKRLQDELREKNAMLAKLSTTDPVTNLRSRRFISEVYAIEFLRASRYGTPLAILMADLDHFKRVNDRYGHPSGDAVLREVGQLVLANLRATDVAGRYGGEEILVLLPHTELDGGAALAERIRVAVEAHRFSSVRGDPIRITVSIGVAGMLPVHRKPEDLLQASDEALYRAKRLGRNRVVVWQPPVMREN